MLCIQRQLAVAVRIVRFIYNTAVLQCLMNSYLIFHLLGIARFISTFLISAVLKIEQMALGLRTALFKPLFLYLVGKLPNLNT